MKVKRPVLFSLAFLLSITYILTTLNAKITHPENLSCNSCHLAKGNISQKNAKTLISSQEELCKNCHKNALTASHPSGFKPTQQLPEEFPLDWKGDLTCSTCHNIHNGKRGYLRVSKYGKTLCLSCHQTNFFTKMKDGGYSLLSGHLDANESLTGNIDSFSVQCMSCHESLPNELNIRITSNIIRHSRNRASHPIGMLYKTSMLYGGYRMVSELPKQVLLPDGRISCISCHQAYSDKHGKLVIENRGSKLCFSCHDI